MTRLTWAEVIAPIGSGCSGRVRPDHPGLDTLDRRGTAGAPLEHYPAASNALHKTSESTQARVQTIPKRIAERVE